MKESIFFIPAAYLSYAIDVHVPRSFLFNVVQLAAT